MYIYSASGEVNIVYKYLKLGEKASGGSYIHQLSNNLVITN